MLDIPIDNPSFSASPGVALQKHSQMRKAGAAVALALALFLAMCTDVRADREM